jgi:tetratricopeptide (TPR) repeat protein
MKSSKLNARALALLLAGAVICAGFTMPVHASFAQNRAPLSPPRTGYVNDFAGVLDSATKQRLENTLRNLLQRSEIELVVATVKSTGDLDIADYSRQMADEWKIAGSGKQKNLLLVVATDTGKSFAQASRSVRGDLPDGILGEVRRRMQTQLDVHEFSEGLASGVQTFVNLLAENKGFSLVNIDQAPREIAQAAPVENPAIAETKTPAGTDPVVADKPVTSESPAPVETATPTGRPRVVATPTPEPTAPPTPEPTAAATPAPTAEPAATNTPEPTPAAPIATPVESKAPAPTGTENPQPAITTPQPVNAAKRSPDDDEVDLTETLPADKRIDALKAFLQTHPRSPARLRATELIVVARATLGDQKLQAGDVPAGLEMFRLAIAETPAEMTDYLYNDVVSKVPVNLILRGQRAAAIDSAHAIEALVRLNPKRLLALASFYLALEDVGEATRIAEFAVKVAPDLAAAHQALGSARHIGLQLDEAAAEYSRALELDSKLLAARRGLADLKRAAGKSQEAEALYRELLQVNPKDNAARTGLILSLFDLGKKDEAEAELAATLKEDERNILLLTGAAYWYAAHNQAARALELGQKAVDIEPRYTWAQIAMARGLVASKRPLDAERALRFVRKYGRFPTLDYELATVLASMGLYDEAVADLSRSFTLKNGEVETKLAGRALARAAGFTELLARERQASIFQATAADSETNSKMLKALMAFTEVINPPAGQTINEADAIAAGQEFIGGEDPMRAYRQIYVASRLLKRRIAMANVIELSRAAMLGVEAAVDVPAATVAVQADDMKEIRATAISVGGTPSIQEAPRYALSALLRGRIEDQIGWALFNQDKKEEAITHLRLAVGVLPERTPIWRDALWHLGAALEADGKSQQALLYYMKNYVTGLPDPIHRAVIEALYRKVNGSLDGLDEKIGPSPFATAPASAPTPAPSPR